MKFIINERLKPEDSAENKLRHLLSPQITSMASQKTSFKKKEFVKRNLIKGTSPSLHNSQLLISSGIPSFDGLIGGGVPVGSVVLINEDEFGTYAKLMLKYFLAEGIVSQHAVFLYSEDINPEKMIQELPAAIDAEADDTEINEEEEKKMTIAWRYENLKPTSSNTSHRHFGHYFDLSKNMDIKFIKKSDVVLLSQNKTVSCKCFQESIYYTLLKSIQKKLEEGLYFAKQTNSERKILRIAFFHVNSPLWQYDDNYESQKYLLIFLYSLRALIRNAFATCCFTLPYAFHKKDLMQKCIHLADISIQLQSFAGTKCENLLPYRDYHGFFIIQKLAAMNSLIAYNAQASNLAFKLRKKKFVIEAFVLPPELDESTEREQDELLIGSCSSFKSNKLDF